MPRAQLARPADGPAFSATVRASAPEQPVAGDPFSAAPDARPTWGQSSRTFVLESHYSPGTRRVYSGTLHAVEGHLVGCTHLRCLTPRRLADAFRRVCRGAEAATQNRMRSTVRTFLAWCRERDLLPDDGVLVAALPARRPDYRPSSEPGPELLSYCFDAAFPTRDRALWCLVFDTSVRAPDLLSLDVRDFDLAHHRVRVQGRPLEWQRFSDDLVRRLLSGREAGPAFTVAHTRPGTAPGGLSYRRAAEACRYYTGFCLKDFRTAGLAHLTQLGVPRPVLRTRTALLAR